MKRNHFLKTLGLSGILVSIFPIKSFAFIQNKFTRDELIGKGNPNLLGEKFKMQKDTYASFLKMKAEASKENISIELVSAYRSFDKQKQIFENKYRLFLSEELTPLEAINKIIEYSTIPGTSRHHWGTDIDIIDANAPRPESVLEEEHFYGNGPYCKLKEWLNINATSFGFYEVYTNNPDRKGFKHEPWHFSYAPISKPMLEEYKRLDLKKVFEEENILGNEYFTNDFINQYRNEHILDINPELI